MCDRCKDPNKPSTKTYTIKKPDGSSRKTELCDPCAEITRAVYTLTGGKASEAKPSTPDTAADESTSSADSTTGPDGAAIEAASGAQSTRSNNETPAQPSRRRG